MTLQVVQQWHATHKVECSVQVDDASDYKSDLHNGISPLLKQGI